MRKTSLLAVAVLLCISFAAAQKQPVTIQWIEGDKGNHIARVPSHVWLEDGTALLYDQDRGPAPHTFERLDPMTGKRIPILEMARALASLKSVSNGAYEKETLEWPAAFATSGKQAAYVVKGDIYLLDLPSSAFTRITSTEAEEKDPQFSPDGRHLAFVREHDIYVYDLASKQEKRITGDGSPTTLNGTLSWVYWEEIMGRRDTGYWWSPDSKAIAYLQTDESKVPVSTFVDFAPVDQRLIRQPYPKAGEHNPEVRVGVVEVAEPATTHWVNIDKPYEWTLRVNWLPDSRSIAIQTLTRPQTELDLYFADRATGAAKHVLTETDSGWVNVNDDLRFLKDGQHFLWVSERTGYMHLYRYTMEGKLVNAVTSGDWAIASSGGLPFWVHKAVMGVDEKNGWVYVTGLKDSSVERHLYRVRLDGTGFTRVDTEPGSHGIDMSPDAQFYFDNYSTIRTLPTFRLHSADGRQRAVLAAPRNDVLAQFDIQLPELLTVPASDGFKMPAQLLKPANFDPSKKYPVILYVYGGPSAPTIKNAWNQGTLLNNVLAQNGYVCFGVDNRAATGISKRLENTLKERPSVSEAADLIDAVKWLKQQPWVDAERVGVWGWSGGGTNTLNLMVRSKEFKAGISGAPVTDWHYYDSKWAEALMGMPQENPKGYEATSLVKLAGQLTGQLMLIYGTYDDNVHPQNEQAFMDALIKAAKPYEVTVYPMRKHGFIDTPAKIHRDNAMLNFWKANL